MSRALAALLTLVVAIPIVAKVRAVAPPSQSSSRLAAGGGASVTGEVTSVIGHVITLAGGNVTIDASHAKIMHGHGAATIAAVQPGATITAMLHETTAGSAGPLVATAIAILRDADLTFTGTIQSVDVAGSQFLLLSRTIKVDPHTNFVNFGDHGSMARLHTNMHVVVEADVAAGALVASRITLVAPIPPRPHAVSGVVKSAGTDHWLITVGGHDTTFVVNASTRILGAPTAGDHVDVVYTVDSANAHVALSIIQSTEAPKVVEFTGVVKSIEGPRWVITRDHDHKDVVVNWPESVRISPVAGVGDRVLVTATENHDGTYTATAIVPHR
jgi:hypothetical protein